MNHAIELLKRRRETYIFRFFNVFADGYRYVISRNMKRLFLKVRLAPIDTFAGVDEPPVKFLIFPISRTSFLKKTHGGSEVSILTASL